MATEAVLFLNSFLGLAELPALPDRLLQQPSWRTFCVEWGWEPEPTRFEWWKDYRNGVGHLADAANRWAKREPVTLFGPGGHLHLGPNWVAWRTEVKWSWLFEPDPAYRDQLSTAGAELAKVVRCDGTHGLVVDDCSGDADVEDLLQAGHNVSSAAIQLSRRGRVPQPLADRDSLGDDCSWLFSVKIA